MRSESLAMSAALAALLLAPGASASGRHDRQVRGTETRSRANPTGIHPAAYVASRAPAVTPKWLNVLRTLDWARDGKAPAAAGIEPDSDWKEHAFHGHTNYRVIGMDREACLLADSRAQGSVLYREVAPLSPEGLHLTWSWRVNTFPRGADLTRKAGDDRAAAVVVLYRKSILPWKIRALMYVWSRDLPAGTEMSSTYSDQIRILVVRSGPAESWQLEDRDLEADYRRVFGGEADPVKAVGVFTDSDNTHTEASAVYGPLSFARPVNASPVASIGR